MKNQTNQSTTKQCRSELRTQRLNRAVELAKAVAVRVFGPSHPHEHEVDGHVLEMLLKKRKDDRGKRVKCLIDELLLKDEKVFVAYICTAAERKAWLIANKLKRQTSFSEQFEERHHTALLPASPTTPDEATLANELLEGIPGLLDALRLTFKTLSEEQRQFLLLFGVIHNYDAEACAQSLNETVEAVEQRGYRLLKTMYKVMRRRVHPQGAGPLSKGAELLEYLAQKTTKRKRGKLSIGAARRVSRCLPCKVVKVLLRWVFEFGPSLH